MHKAFLLFGGKKTTYFAVGGVYSQFYKEKHDR